jgi:outer membrane receptor protein involved in Fe transport
MRIPRPTDARWLLLAVPAYVAALTPIARAQEAEDDPEQQQAGGEGAAAADAAATPDPAIEEVFVVGRLKATAFDATQERLNQEVVSDFLGVEQITRTGDSTVSLALRRMPGLSLVNDQFIYVRGLGERYSSTLLNHAQVPSPDLTRNVLPLDIFPTQILQALEVQKGYSPDMPAAFGGGNVDILTRGLPDGPVFTVQVGSGYNSESDENGLTYPGGDDDSLGKDDGTRELPQALADAIQTYRGDVSVTGILDGLNRDGNYHPLFEAQAINNQLATSLYRDIDFQSKSMPPDGSMDIALGNRWFFGGEERWQFGALGLLRYENTWRNRERTVRNVVNPEQEYFNQLRTVNQIANTGAINLGLAFTGDHRIDTSSFLLRNSEDESALLNGHGQNYEQSSGRGYREYLIRFEERQLQSNQIRGSHTLGDDTRDILPFLDHKVFDGVTFDWYYSDSKVETDIPSEIKVTADNTVDPVTGDLISTSLRRSGSTADYRYTDLEDDVESYGWDLMRPFYVGDVDVKVSGGQDLSRKGRQYLQTELTLGSTAPTAVPILVGTPGTVLTDSNLLDPLNGFRLDIGGIGTESYLAAQTIDAAYIKADAMLGDTWRLTGGARWEQFNQVSLPIDPLQFDVDVGQATSDINVLQTLILTEDDVYPSLSATYIRPGFWAETFQLRFGVSETVARPDLREISDATYIDPLTEARVRGTPGLQTSPITNYDVRAEWFFNSGDNFTASVFHKDIDRPIETAEGAGSDNDVFVTFINADSAQITGLEVEWLKDLAPLAERWGRWIEPFFFSGNLTFSDSELVVGDVGLDLTHPVRPMGLTSDYVANLQLGFDSENGAHSWSLVYNTFGERLFFAGRSGAQDTYEQPFDSLDLIYSYYPTDHLSLKFKFQNLLDEKIELENAGVTVLEQSVGRSAKIDIKWDLGP